MNASQRGLRHKQVLLSLALGAFSLAGCNNHPPMPKWPITSPAELCGDPSLGKKGFCMPSAKIEKWLREGSYTVTRSAISSSGLTAPYKLRLQTNDGPTINVKFKRAPDALDAFNNSPRLELAAYEVQKLFLDETDYVVPPTLLVCLPQDKYPELLADLKPQPGLKCTVGLMAYWIEGISDEDIIDNKEWARDPAYRDSLGNLNVLTVMIGHQDSIGDNFYRSKDRDHPRVFSIDNGLAFGAMGYNPIQWFSSKWSSFRIPAIPEQVVDRLRKVTRERLERLSSISQLETKGGTLVITDPGSTLDPTVGVRHKNGVIQMGLTDAEIADVEARRVKILDAIDNKKLKEDPKEPAAEKAAQPSN